MDKKNFAFDKMNYILLAVGMLIVVIGFLLMTGPASTETTFEPDIFTTYEAGTGGVSVRLCVDDLCHRAETKEISKLRYGLDRNSHYSHH